VIWQRWDELSDRLAKALESSDPEGCISASGDPELAELFRWHRRAGDFLETRQPKPENPWIGRRIHGRYRLESVLGRGGSGVVFCARDEEVAGRRIVIKLLHDFWSSEDWMRRRFREEAAVLARLVHPGIVSLVDAGEAEDGRLFLAFPFHESRTLREALSQGPLDSPFAARLLREIGDALGYAHAQAVLHRDLKPENILLVRRADGEYPLLIDFGIAQIGDAGVSTHTTTHLMGSAVYMAPEHLMGKPVAASDIYSLGVVAWEMLAGTRPFDSVSPFALPELQRRGAGDAFYRLRPDLGTGIGKLLARALAFDPARRPAPVTAFTAQLADALLAGAMDSRIARLWVLRRSRRWMLAGGTTALMGAAAGGWWLRDRLTPLSPADRIVDLPLPSEPEEHGFRARSAIGNEVLSNPESSGYLPAIRVIARGQQGGYYYPLTRAQVRAANRRGWKLSFEAAPEEGQIYAMVDLPDAPRRYAINLIATPNQPDAILLLTAITPTIQGIDLPLPGPAGVRHSYRIEFQPRSATVDLWVDGAKRYSGYTGLSEFCYYRGPEMGAHRYRSARGAGVFWSFRFEIA
jgi:serine/threonine protein kinase